MDGGNASAEAHLYLQSIGTHAARWSDLQHFTNQPDHLDGSQ